MKIAIVGAGLYGLTMARLLTDKGYSVTVFEKRSHIGGNCYTDQNGTHIYGPHIFHTSNQQVIDFIKKYTTYKPFQLNVLATNGNKIYHLPFNMTTFYEVYGVKTPKEAKQLVGKIKNPKNLEEKAIQLVGQKMYETLIKPYTEKQWKKSCKDLPARIIERLPVRFEYNNNYFNDSFQCIPDYELLFKNLSKGIDIKLNYNFILKDIDNFDKVIYSGAIDELYNYQLGKLSWRGCRFEYQESEDRLGTPIMNQLVGEATRIYDNYYFDNRSKTIVTEYPDDNEKFYPIDDNELYEQYVRLANPKIFLGGRLGLYKYLNMDDVIELAFKDMGNWD